MRFFLPLLALATLCLSIVSCRPNEESNANQQDSSEHIWFAVDPSGKSPRATDVKEQMGDNLGERIEATNFLEITIAQGSGLDGFDAVRVFHDGTGYLVFSKERSFNQKLTIKLSEDELDELIGAINTDKISEIKGSYSAGWADGTQGFIEIITNAGRRHCWLDNHFDPVAKTFDYCNQAIWPKLEGAEPEDAKINRQAEYQRVFSP